MYNTTVYAVVSDNASHSPMLKMGRLVKHIIWHCTCNSHTGNLLAKDVTDKILNENISLILKEYKHPDLEKLVINRGGQKMKLPCETRWCSYICHSRCFGIRGGHGKSSFKLAVKPSVKLGYVFLSLRL
jgi:hypothetical protein